MKELSAITGTCVIGKNTKNKLKFFLERNLSSNAKKLMEGLSGKDFVYLIRNSITPLSFFINFTVVDKSFNETITIRNKDGNQETVDVNFTFKSLFENIKQLPSFAIKTLIEKYKSNSSKAPDPYFSDNLLSIISTDANNHNQELIAHLNKINQAFTDLYGTIAQYELLKSNSAPVLSKSNPDLEPLPLDSLVRTYYMEGFFNKDYQLLLGRIKTDQENMREILGSEKYDILIKNTKIITAAIIRDKASSRPGEKIHGLS